MNVNGIDLGNLDAQFKPANEGKVLLLDGDFLIYQAAATVKTLPTAVRRFYTLVMTEMFLTGCTECRVYLTPTGNKKCDRYYYPATLKYQDNRVKRQELPLKGPLKQHIIDNPAEYADKNIHAVFDDWHEADDLLIQDSYQLKGDSILSSGDKDLRLTPYPWWDAKTGTCEATLDTPYGYIYFDPDEAAPLKGRGTAFFWAQMLMGDSADNVKGITKLDGKNCGPSMAYKFLKDFKTEAEAAHEVVSAYARNGQDVLAEAQMMWLRRNSDDDAYTYLKEVITDESLLAWIDSLNEYHKQYIAYAKEQHNG